MKIGVSGSDNRIPERWEFYFCLAHKSPSHFSRSFELDSSYRPKCMEVSEPTDNLY
jgi:hypothetical protein